MTHGTTLEEVDEEDTLPTTVEEVQTWVASAPRTELEAQAGWWLRSLAKAQHEAATIDAREEAELERLRAHYAKQREPIVYRIGALERSLEAVAELIAFEGKRKSVALAWGTIGRRSVGEKMQVTDDEAALVFARSVEGATKSVEKIVAAVATAAALARMKETGEEVGGFTFTAEHEKAFAKVNDAYAAGVR